VNPGRFLTTMLFADIVGSTELAARLGDRRWRELLDAHQAAVRQELERFHGREIDSAGDGFLAVFDRPERAIRCAQALRDSTRRLGIQIRVGLHTGEVETAGAAVRGIAVHMGARVAAEAGPGEILVSSTVRDLVAGSEIQFEDRGLRALKGVPEERRLFAVTAVGTAGTVAEGHAGVQSGLRIRLLGDFRVALAGHEIAASHWRLKKPRSLIKLLALAPGHRLHREQVLEILWPELDTTAASNNLRKALHVARRALASADAVEAARYLQLQHELMTLGPDGDLWIDAEAFEQMAAEARARNNPETFLAALDLYTGDLLPEDRYEDWSSGRREALRLAYLSVLADLASHYERDRQFTPAIEILQRLLQHDPGREEAHAALMRVYALTGQRQQALRQYQVLKEAINREFDAEADPATQRLYQEILAGKISPVARAGPVRPRQEASARLSNLPLQLTSFIGRVRELDEISEMIGIARHITLTGPAGVGKTRLALEAAARVQAGFPDGLWLVDFSPLSDPARAPQALAATLGVPEQTGRPLPEVVGDYLMSKRALLVLDNCEHITAACAELAEYLLRRCPEVRVLATSREVLGTAGEQVYGVPSLSLPDPRRLAAPDELTGYEAVRLFADRAALSRPGFALTDASTPAVVQICRRLDGIPLAIELAAARVKTLDVDAIAARLDDRFRLLTGGTRTALPRHRTLRAAMDWSYDLLSDPERGLLRRLSVFAGGFTLEAVEAVCTGGGIEQSDVLDLLARLVDKSLIAVDQSKKTRYRLLETIRQYARERLVETDAPDAALRRHRDFFLALVEEAAPEFRGPNQMEWLNRIGAEHDNIRAALEWSLGQPEDEPPVRLAAAASWYWHARGYLIEGREWLDRALQRVDGAAPALRMKALIGAGRLAFAQDDYGRAQTIFEQVVPLAREAGDVQAMAMALAWLGHSTWHQGDRAGGVAISEESLALARKVAEPWTTAIVLDEVAIVARHERDHERAVSLLEESLRFFREVGDLGGIALCLSRLGALASDRAEYQRAALLIEEALSLQRALGRRTAAASSLNRLGWIALAQGDYEAAIERFEASAAIADELGKRSTAAGIRVNAGMAALAKGDAARGGEILHDCLAVQREYGDADDVAIATTACGILARCQGDHDRARQLLEAGLTTIRETSGAINLATPLYHLGALARAQGDYDQAITLLREGMMLQRKHGDRLGIAGSLEGLAGVLLSRGTAKMAVRLFGAADRLREAIGAPRWTIDQEAWDDDTSAARAALGEAAFTEAWDAGRAMTTESAVELALTP
jgi:predicted ATPase/DNA-binding SARP family transcriptional activator